jgi:uncharacterized membrane protein
VTAQNIVVSLHVLAAIVVLGPLIFATSATPRAIRSGDAKTLGFLVSTTRIYAIVSLVVPILGAGAVHKKYGYEFSQTWVWLSIVLYVVALGLFTGLVGGAQKKALALVEDGKEAEPRLLAMINAGAGLSAVAIGAIAFLMIFQPGLG